MPLPEAHEQYCRCAKAEDKFFLNFLNADGRRLVSTRLPADTMAKYTRVAGALRLRAIRPAPQKRSRMAQQKRMSGCATLKRLDSRADLP
jgi:hypothetical protein